MRRYLRADRPDARDPVADLAVDPEYHVAVPFACGGLPGEPPDPEPGSVRRLSRRRVTQCALSRICGLCGDSLDRPVAFVGTETEAGRNAFHFPPMHPACADIVRRTYPVLGPGVLGIGDPAEQQTGDWVQLATSGFEFERPGRDAVDPRPTFIPNSILAEQ